MIPAALRRLVNYRVIFYSAKNCSSVSS